MTCKHSEDIHKYTDRYCPCKEYATATTADALIALITKLPAMGLWFKRDIVSDTVFLKFMGVLTMLISSVTLALALDTFADNCYRGLPKTVQIYDPDVDAKVDVSLDYDLGPGCGHGQMLPTQICLDPGVPKKM
ncbi:hypothetical protein CYMTET_51908 [Cymbomonas tetramitiformis]|uniref:Uncharacterized protein n=1 Tax=Cymbomonas tetramitiformis TaxID=36881 RepID=A0AAE0BL93_9CHLO|nr:hypothetical protein CYMTET_51908 [Cymbomonas tetramitiformis]